MVFHPINRSISRQSINEGNKILKSKSGSREAVQQRSKSPNKGRLRSLIMDVLGEENMTLLLKLTGLTFKEDKDER